VIRASQTDTGYQVFSKTILRESKKRR